MHVFCRNTIYFWYTMFAYIAMYNRSVYTISAVCLSSQSMMTFVQDSPPSWVYDYNSPTTQI